MARLQTAQTGQQDNISILKFLQRSSSKKEVKVDESIKEYPIEEDPDESNDDDDNGEHDDPSEDVKVKKDTITFPGETELDPDILAQLPLDIKQEVLASFGSGKWHNLGETVMTVEDRLGERADVAGEDIDRKILLELPPEIRAEVEAKYGVKHEPQASTSSVSSLVREEASTSAFTSEQQRTPVKQKRSPVRAAEAEDSLEISFSQVDPAVLGELPASLQRELEKHYSKREARRRKDERLADRGRNAFTAIMQCSSSPGKQASSITRQGKARRGRKKGSVSAKTSRTGSDIRRSPGKLKAAGSYSIELEDNSSVDMEVFSALPASIQAEVEAQMKRNEDNFKVKTSHPIDTIKEETEVSEKVSDEEVYHSDEDMALNETNQKRHGNKWQIEFEDNNSVDMEVFNALPESIQAELEAEMKINEKLNPESSTPIDGDQEDESQEPDCDSESQYSFCGATTLAEKRTLLRDWVVSASSPGEADLALLSDHLAGLVAASRVDLVQLLLRCLHRNIARLAGPGLEWRQAWRGLVDTVQVATIAHYGLPLHVPETL